MGPGYIAYGDSNEALSKSQIPVRILLDSGAEVACLAERVLRNKQYPVQKRGVPEPLLAFTGHPVPGTGKFWIRNLSVRGEDFRLTLPSVEVVDMVGDHDLIVPEDWVSRSRKRHCASSEKTFKETHGQTSSDISTPCLMGCSKPELKKGLETMVDVVSGRELEWDETVLEDVDRQVCALFIRSDRTMATVGKKTEGPIPTPNRKPRSLLSLKMFDRGSL